MTPEAKVKAKVDARLKAYNAVCVNPIGGEYAQNGVADKLACREGRFIAIEAKAGRNMPTALQIRFLMDVEAAGGVGLVINEHNMLDLEQCLLYPHHCKSNYQQFITPAVRQALNGTVPGEQPTLRKRVT